MMLSSALLPYAGKKLSKLSFSTKQGKSNPLLGEGPEQFSRRRTRRDYGVGWYLMHP